MVIINWNLMILSHKQVFKNVNCIASTLSWIKNNILYIVAYDIVSSNNNIFVNKVCLAENGWNGGI